MNEFADSIKKKPVLTEINEYWLEYSPEEDINGYFEDKELKYKNNKTKICRIRK